MQWIHMNEKQLYFLLNGLKIVGSGGNGRVYQYDDKTLAKVYIGFLGESCGEVFDVEKTIANILKWNYEEKLMKCIYEDYETTSERIQRIISRLEGTCCSDLIQGGIFYQDFLLSSLLLDYTKMGYVDYRNICEKLSIDENYDIMSKVQKLVCDLMEEYIYLTDIKFGNVMVRKDDLSVRLIDVDDRWAKYENCKNYLYHLDVLCGLEKMKGRILKKK